MPAYFCEKKTEMALLLHIDTALETAFVGLSHNGDLLMELSNNVQTDHAAFVQPAIQQVLRASKKSVSDIDAVGVTSGPGSYTGIRVGMASAKGICYALHKPLLTVSTLEAMTLAAVEKSPGFDLYAPMIDARRQEVYTALYQPSGYPVLAPFAAILSAQLFSDHTEPIKILCFGTGADKWQKSNSAGGNIYFGQMNYNGGQLCQLLFNMFRNKQYQNLAYTEPLYVKDFFSGRPGTAL